MKTDFSVKTISPKLAGAQNPNDPTSSHDLVETMEFLYVQVIQLINNSVVNPIPQTSIPIVELTLGNHKFSTNGLPIGPNMDWNQVFAFDKTEDDVLSVTLSLKEEQSENSTVIGKRDFKLASDIPSRVSPDARIVPQCYYMEDNETDNHVMLLMSVWFGTQADELYSQAWFSNPSASCVINTQPKIYLTPRLCYVRVTIVSCLISNDEKQILSVYVKATLGEQVLETRVSSRSDPFWNTKLTFVASEPLNDTLYLSLINIVDDEQEECIGKLEKKLSEIKDSGSVYNIEPAVEGDSKRFSRKISMKLATDLAYHIFDECSQYSKQSDLVGELEIGILGATGLETTKTSSSDTYVVAKYGNKWVRTRTVVDSFSPKWNEKHSWDVYDKRTFITLGVYDKDVPIGKVRISLRSLESDKLYTRSFPMILDSEELGLEKTGELDLAIRYISLTKPVALSKPLFLPKLFPKPHYISRLSRDQTEKLREEASKLICLNLAESPLGDKVVKDMLKPENRRLASMRRCKANYEFLSRMVHTLSMWFAWFNANVRLTTDMSPKLVTCAICGLLLCFPKLIMFLAVCLVFVYTAYKILRDTIKRNYGIGIMSIDTPPGSVLEEDLKLDDLDLVKEKVVTFLGDERLHVLFKACDDPVASIYLWTVVSLILLMACTYPVQVWGICLMFYLVNFPCFRNDLPSGIFDFLRRLPTEEDVLE